MDKKGKILIVDDNEDVLFALNALLSSYVEKVRVSTKPENIIKYIEEYQPDVILLDMNFQKDVISGQEGFFWLEQILTFDPQAIVILMTAYVDTEKAVQAIKVGATDFISKPWQKEKLLATIFSALKLKESKKEVEILKYKMQSFNVDNSNLNMVGESEAMTIVFDMIDKLADTDANVLILGENGTGKDLVARAIYRNSLRAENIFVSIDLGTVPENLFESELFGYEKGAFTDAKNGKIGRLEIASGGTLFLDEIGNLSLPMQVKMLTAIEKKQITRLGSTKNIPIDVRIISATNTDIYQAIDDGRFRQDLLYRINTIEIQIPPLRKRGKDILLLTEYFLKKFNHKYKKKIRVITKDAKDKLMKYDWPGNVRELQNVIERTVILSSGQTLKPQDFILTSSENKKVQEQTFNLEKLEQETIERAIAQSDGNINKAADLLGISRFALYRKINRGQN
jgi:DNA-binding NtrC family response regulator